MKIILNILSFIAVLSTSQCLYADGKMYSKYTVEQVNTEIPYQRALIVHTGGTETMVLQSSYRISGSITDETPDISELAWIVPVPDIPELASTDSETAHYLFWEMSRRSSPRVTIISQIIIQTTIIIFIATALLFTILILKNRNNPDSRFYQQKANITNFISGIIIILILSGTLLPTLSRSKDTNSNDVEVISRGDVGIYSTAVIRSGNADTISDWLNDNGFKYQNSDKEALSTYTAKGWYFVAARVKTDISDQNNSSTISDYGIPSPLILRFASNDPVYPMVLTGTGGFDTEVLVYLLTDRKMTCSQLELRCATQLVTQDHFFFLEEEITPKYFGRLIPPGQFWLMKCKSTLKPEQMTEDIIFQTAPDQLPYREHIVKFK